MKHLFLTAILLLPVVSARAQATNADVMARMGVACMARAVSEPEAVALDGPDRLPFIRSAIVNSWLASGVTVLDGSSAGERRVSRVTATVESAGVSYGRISSGWSDRTVALALRIRAVANDGSILFDDVCTDRAGDRIPASSFDLVENQAYAETVGSKPERGFFRRVIQPAVIGAASAVGVLLFFSLRSRRAPSEG